jgi:hypothetical protein
VTPGPVARRPVAFRTEAQKRPLRANPSPRGRSTPTFSESEYESDEGGTRTLSATRRPRRSKPIDVTRDLIVLHPRDNVKERMEIDGSDLEEFLEALNEEDPMSASIDAPADSELIVHTPRVSTAPAACATPHEDGKGLRKSKSEKCNIKRIKSEEQVTWSGPSAVLKHNAGYFEYDADSEDERFLQSLSPTVKSHKQQRSKASTSSPKTSVDIPVSPAQLEGIVAMLERELEVARRFEDKNRAARVQYRRLQSSIESSSLILCDLKPLLLTSDSSSSSRRVASREESLDATVTRALNTSESALQDGLHGESLNPSDPAGPPSPLSTSNHWANGEANGRPPSGKAAVANKDPLPAFISVPEIAALLPWSRARALMAIAAPGLLVGANEGRASASKKSVVPNAGSSTGGSRVSSSKGPTEEPETEEYDYEADSKSVAERIYLYWLHKRSKSRTSLLRGFHVFLMENWKSMSSVGVAIPPITEDEHKSELLRVRANLVRIRADLDRARLISDLVRKREKVKKMMFRGACDGMDAEFMPAPVAKKGKATLANKSTLQPYQFYISHDCGNDLEEKNSALSKLNGLNASIAVKRGRADSDSGRGGEDDSNLSHTTRKKTRIFDTFKSASSAVPSVTKYITKGDRERNNGLQSPKSDSEPLLAKLPQPSLIKYRNTPVCVGVSDQITHRSEDSIPRSKSVPCSLQRAGHQKGTSDVGKKAFDEGSVVRSKSGQFVSSKAKKSGSFTMKKELKNSKYFRYKR